MNSSISPETARRIDVDADWQDMANLFPVRDDTIYLNHGSFGITARPVRAARDALRQQMDQQPMDYYVRQFEPLWNQAISQLGRFVNTNPQNLVFVENATFGMNTVADSFPLSPDDEVLSNNHEYGAVKRIWERACARQGARYVEARLPDQFESSEQIVDAVLAPASDRTKLLIVSHITSPTALIMPVAEICAAAARRGIPVCIDGPHAPAHVPLDLDRLGCGFYTASCHKWLSAPLGSGFLYAAPEFHSRIQPPLQSWGRLLPAVPEHWTEEFIWSGTRDSSPYFSIPDAIELLETIGLDSFRGRIRHLAARTTGLLTELTSRSPMGVDWDQWYGAMSHVPLPVGDWSDLQQWLWQEHQIEVPIVHFEDDWYIRVSHHLYTTTAHVDRLLVALRQRLGGSGPR